MGWGGVGWGGWWPMWLLCQPSPKNWVFGFFRLGLTSGSGFGDCWARGLGIYLEHLHPKIWTLNGFKLYMLLRRRWIVWYRIKRRPLIFGLFFKRKKLYLLFVWLIYIFSWFIAPLTLEVFFHYHSLSIFLRAFSMNFLGGNLTFKCQWFILLQSTLYGSDKTTEHWMMAWVEFPCNE